MKRPRSSYYRTSARWFFVASVVTIPLALWGRHLPEALWKLIATIFFWPANLVLFPIGPPYFGHGPQAVGYQLAFMGLYFLFAIPLNGIGWGVVGFLRVLTRDVFHDGIRPHKK